MNKYIIDIVKDYIKKYVLIESYFDMDHAAFDYTEKEQTKNLDKKDLIEYVICLDTKNKMNIFISRKKTKNGTIAKKIGSIEFLKKDFIIEVPKKYIKRSYYNSINNLFYKEECQNDIILNYQYIENLPKWILSNKDKTELFYSNREVKIEKLKIILEQKNLIFVNKKTFSKRLKYVIDLYESETKFTNISQSTFRKNINKKISEIYTLNKFGKNFNRLNKKELKILEIENY